MNNFFSFLTFNNKVYGIYNENGKLGYANIDDKINYSISLDEKNILDKFYDYICFKKCENDFCGCYMINGKSINIYKSLRNGLYSFMSNDSISSDDIFLLNSYFNVTDVMCFDKKKKHVLSNYIKLSLKISGIVISALIVPTVLIYNLSSDTKNDLFYGISRKLRSDYKDKSKDYSYSDIVSSIDRNDNISLCDKKFVIEVFQKEFEENKQYIDIESLIKRLESFKVIYDKYYVYDEKSDCFELNNKDVSSLNPAYYDVSKNELKFIEDSYDIAYINKNKDIPFGFEDVSKSVYNHELNHLLTGSTFDTYFSYASEYMSFSDLGNFLSDKFSFYNNFSSDMVENFNTSFFCESINEIFNREYIEEYYDKNKDEDYVCGYVDEVPYMYCLMEILPNEVLREYKFNDDDSIILDGLLEICNDKEKAYSLLTSLKSMSLYDNLVLNALETSDTEKISSAKEERDENYKRIHDGFEFFYSSRYGYSMSNDMVMLIYLYNTNVISDFEKSKLFDFLGIDFDREIKFTPKGYFSDYCISKFPNVCVKYLCDYDYVTLDIPDYNRYFFDDKKIK